MIAVDKLNKLKKYEMINSSTLIDIFSPTHLLTGSKAIFERKPHDDTTHNALTYLFLYFTSSLAIYAIHMRSYINVLLLFLLLQILDACVY